MPRSCVVLAALVSMLGCSDAGGPTPQAVPKSEGIVTVSLTFDDTNANQWEASRVMERFDVLGTFYVNSPRIGQSNRLTEEQLHTLEAEGHEIGGHTLDHPHLDTITDRDELRRQICDDAQALRDKGFRITSFAYPYGDYSAIAIEVVRSCYENARTVGTFDRIDAESIPPENAFVIRAPSSVNNTPLTELQGLIDAARNEEGWVLLTFHHITDDIVGYRITPADFEAFLQWLADERDAGRVKIETVRDVMTP